MSKSTAATCETIEIPLFESTEAAAASAPSESAAPPDQPEPAPIALPLKAAVRNCLDAYNRAFAAELEAGATESKAEHKAEEAYRNHMPILTTRGNVQAFIACVAWGIVHRTFRHDEGPRFLSAARTALAALPREAHKLGRPTDPDSVP